MTTGRNGQAVERYEYDAYGKPYNGWYEHSAHNQNPFGFTGNRYSNQLGTWNFAYRTYNSNSMRWMTRDPIKDGLNWYQYCYSDPVNYIDPDGRNTAALGAMWTAALAEPTPVGEAVVSVATVGYGVYSIATTSQVQKARDRRRHDRRGPIQKQEEKQKEREANQPKEVKANLNWDPNNNDDNDNDEDEKSTKQKVIKNAVELTDTIGKGISALASSYAGDEKSKESESPEPKSHVTHPQTQQAEVQDESDK